MRTADRLVAGDWAFPLGLDENRHFLEHVASQLRQRGEHRPVVVADNVARYVHDRNPAICLENYPSLAPPWPVFWVEYPSSGRQRRGVFVADLTDLALEAAPATAVDWQDNDVDEWIKGDVHIPALGAAAIVDAERNGSEREAIRWVVTMCLFVEQDRRVWGPAGILCLALDHGGQVLGNRWSVAPVMGLRAKTEDVIHASSTDPAWEDDDPIPSLEEILERAKSMSHEERVALRDQLVARAELAGERADFLRDRIDALQEAARTTEFLGSLGDASETTWLIRALAATLQTVAFLHCKNVALDTVDAPEPVQAKRRKKGKQPLLRYHTLALDVPRSSSGGGPGEPHGGTKALHIVAGHFAHYGACCPNHEPRGLLFGRLTGVYWVPSHARGDLHAGEVRTDFEVRKVGAS